ncbi:MAG TPA: hypothetical protein DEB48_12845 [Verrucomicrobiales bacterium]|nr:hypothetical protein [Verrucomicrobiales bacterium]
MLLGYEDTSPQSSGFCIYYATTSILKQIPLIPKKDIFYIEFCWFLEVLLVLAQNHILRFTFWREIHATERKNS